MPDAPRRSGVRHRRERREPSRRFPTLLLVEIGGVVIVLLVLLLSGVFSGREDPAPEGTEPAPMKADGDADDVSREDESPRETASALLVPDAVTSAITLPTAKTAVAPPDDTDRIELACRLGVLGFQVGPDLVATPVKQLEPVVDAARDHDHLFSPCTRPLVIAMDGRELWARANAAFIVAYYLRFSRVYLSVTNEAGGAAAIPIAPPFLEEDSPGQPWRGGDLEIDLSRLGEAATWTAARLTEITKQREVNVVRITAAPLIPYADVVAVVDACRAAELERVWVPPSKEGLRMVILLLPTSRRGTLEVVLAAPRAVRGRTTIPVAKAAKDETDEEVGVEILVPTDGEVWCAGRRMSPRELSRHLRDRADASRETTPPHASKAGVLLTVDGKASWRMVQWIMQTCADPDVLVYRIRWSVRPPDGGEGQLAAFLPFDRGLAQSPQGPVERQPSMARLSLEQPPGSDEGVMLVLHRLWPTEKLVILGTLEEGLPKAAKQFRTLAGRNPGAGIEISALPDTPFADLVRMVDAAMSAGLTNLVFTGAPPPRGGGDEWR